MKGKKKYVALSDPLQSVDNQLRYRGVFPGSFWTRVDIARLILFFFLLNVLLVVFYISGFSFFYLVAIDVVLFVLAVIIYYKFKLYAMKNGEIKIDERKLRAFEREVEKVNRKRK